MARSRDSTILETTAAVMAQLGGPAKVAALTGADYKTVWPWAANATFPSRYFVVMTNALADLGLRAPPSLWGMVERDAAAKPSRRRAVA